MTQTVQNLIALLDHTFRLGECECPRCILSKGKNDYGYPHNFEIDGKVYRRLFEGSTKENFDIKTRAAWSESYPGADTIVSDSQINIEQAKELLGEHHYQLFFLLGNANGLFANAENGLITVLDHNA